MEPQAPPPDPMTEAALTSLKDIAIPEPVAWLPQTWGWAMLAGLLGVTLIVFGWRWLRAYRCRKPQRIFASNWRGPDTEQDYPALTSQ